MFLCKYHFFTRKLPIMKKNHLIFYLGISLMVMLIVSGCAKEAIHPNPVPADFKIEEVDLSNPTMTDADFASLSSLAKEMASTPAPDGTPSPQAYYISRRYLINYSPQVTIGVGGAVYNRSSEEWAGGANAGSTPIDPQLFAQLSGNIPQTVRLNLTWSWFYLWNINIVLEDQGGQTISGLYNTYSREFLFLGFAGTSNTSCGAVGAGRIYGQLPGQMNTITNGEHGYGFIAGCSPLVIAASINFYYTGTLTY